MTSFKHKPEKCPECGSANIASILWGLPDMSAELNADLVSGRVVLGGCCVSHEDPAWKCNACGAELFRSDGPLV